MPLPNNNAVVLISGGLDSCVTLAHALEYKQKVFPINFAYGQRHSREVVAGQKILEHYGLPDPITFNMSQVFHEIGGSSLTSGKYEGNPSLEPVNRTEDKLPPTFVPGRNIIMLSIAAAYAYTVKAESIWGGWNAVDYSGYPDCRPEFLERMYEALAYGLMPLDIVAPLVYKTKEQIIKRGLDLNAPLHLTWSCYSGGSVPCRTCDSCVIRAKGFLNVGIPDPALE